MFHTQLRVRAVRGSVFRELTRTLVYELRNRDEIVVPKGFMTNYASIPKALRWFIDQDGPAIRDISVVHDYLYSQGNLYRYTRRQADQILYQGMREQGAGWFKAGAAYLAVRWFGKSNFKQDKKLKPRKKTGRQDHVKMAAYLSALTAALLILMPLVLSGCSVTGIAKAKAGQYVSAYCGQTEAEKVVFRTLIHDSISPNTINLECVDAKTNTRTAA